MDSKVEEALEFIKEQVETYGVENLAILNSFGKDSMVVLHLVMRVVPSIRVLWIKPPFLPEDTIRFARYITGTWRLNLHTLTSKKEEDAEFMDTIIYKPKLWKTNPELCCQIFKVEPSMRAVVDMKLHAWFSGMRKTESEKRGMYTWIWRQGPFTKLHPIIDFTEADIWRYIACYKIPIHPWYVEGYRSLGCDVCSFPNTWESERGGRWKDTMMEGGDCGIHCVVMPVHPDVRKNR